MEIAYVTETWPPEINGVAFTAARAVRHLREAGHGVWLVRPRQRGEALRDDEDEWRTPGLPIPLYPELRMGWAGTAALRARLRERMPALVHVATPGPLARQAVRAARSLGIPCTADFRTNFHAYSRHYRCGWAEPLVLAWLRSLHRQTVCSFAPTASIAAALSQQGFGTLRVAGRGVDARRFAPEHRDAALRAAWGAGADDPVALVVGRVAAEKDVALAIDAARHLQHGAPRLRLVVVGDGPQRALLERAHPDVVFAGTQRGEALARHYASADLFLFPSRTETFGNVVLEAAASGLAIAAFDRAAAQAHLYDGVSACLAAEGGDAAAFVDAARRALAGAAPGSVLREGARRAALAADWGPVLRSFERELCRAAAGAARVPHAAVA